MGSMRQKLVLMDIDNVTKKSLTEFKKQVEKKIDEYVKKRIREEKKTARKLRFLNPARGRQMYLNECGLSEGINILKIRLNMVKARDNFKNTETDSKCRICMKESETTEHVLGCMN